MIMDFLTDHPLVTFIALMALITLTYLFNRALENDHKPQKPVHRLRLVPRTDGPVVFDHQPSTDDEMEAVRRACERVGGAE